MLVFVFCRYTVIVLQTATQTHQFNGCRAGGHRLAGFPRNFFSPSSKTILGPNLFISSVILSQHDFLGHSLQYMNVTDIWPDGQTPRIASFRKIFLKKTTVIVQSLNYLFNNNKK